MSARTGGAEPQRPAQFDGLQTPGRPVVLKLDKVRDVAMMAKERSMPRSKAAVGRRESEMNRSSNTGLSDPRSSRLPGLLAAVVVITLAAIFWTDLRALPLGWQIAIGFLAVVVVLRMLVAGLNLDRSQVAIADTLYNAGQYQKALEELARVLQQNPSNAEAFYLRGQCLDRLGRGSEAMAAWQEALKHNPKHGKSAHNLACEYLNQRKLLEAAEYFAIAREGGAWAEGPSVFEQNVENTKKALIHVGRQAETRGDHREVLRYADALVRLVPDYALAYTWRAQHNAQLGNYRVAVEDARKGLQLDPKYDKARMILESAEEALNASIADSQLCSAPSHAVPEVASTSPTAPTLMKRGGAGTDTPPGEAPTLWRVGDVAFDRWEIRRIINRGAMGTIYAAWDPQSRYPVALKAIQLESDADSGPGRKQFRREAEYWLRLGTHPRVVRLLSVEKLDFRHLVMVMEYVAGQPDVGPTLYDHLKAKKSLTPQEACRVAIGICEGMRFAYDQRKLVHRDLKPENVFITALGDVKVGDFGLATVEGQKPDRPAGTLAYAAPEQWDEDTVARSALDVYALGVMLFEMVCGRRPFELTHEYQHAIAQVKQAEYERMHREMPPPSPRAYCNDLSPKIETLILRCLAKRPSDRPMSFEELEMALRKHVPDISESEPAHAGPGSEQNPGFAVFDQGVSLTSLGLFEEALECHEKAARYEPLQSQRSEAWTNRAQVLGHLHRFEESVAAARRAMEIDPRDLHAQHCLAMSLGMLGSHKEALSAFDCLIAQDLQRADSHAGKACVLLDAGDTKGAKAAYEQALALKPEHHIAVNGLGLCAEQDGDLETALQYFERAIGIDGEFAEAHANRDRVLILLGRKEEAPDRTADAEPDGPRDIAYYLNLGFSLHNRARFAEARDALNKALKLDPANALVHLALAQCCGELGDYALALEHGRKAVALGDPRGAQIAELARLCVAGKDPRGTKARGRVTPAPRGGLGASARQHRTSSQASDAVRRSSRPEGQRRQDATQPKRSAGTCSCGFRNLPDNTFCHRCGRALGSEASAKCPHCGEEMSGPTNFCVHCGKKLS